MITKEMIANFKPGDIIVRKDPSCGHLITLRYERTDFYWVATILSNGCTTEKHTPIKIVLSSEGPGKEWRGPLNGDYLDYYTLLEQPSKEVYSQNRLDLVE